MKNTSMSLVAFALLACGGEPSQGQGGVTPVQPNQTPAPVADDFTTVLRMKRNALIALSTQNLEAVIAELAGNPGSPLLMNKGKIFSVGLSNLKTLVGLNPALSTEEIFVRKHGTAFSRSDVDPTQKLPTITFTDRWMDYANVNHTLPTDETVSVTFANFANERLGGGWRSYGNVQEEQMVQRCPDFALLLSTYNPTRTAHTLYTRKGGNLAHPGSADPLLITGLRFILAQSDADAQSDAINKPNYSVLDHLTVVPDAPSVNMIAMAAPELGAHVRGGRAYDIGLLSDLFENAFSAFRLVKLHDESIGKTTQLYSGLWGAGAFGHNANVSILVQTIAARLAGIGALEFTGTQATAMQVVVDLGNATFDRALAVNPGNNSQFLQSLSAEMLSAVTSRGWKTKR